MTAAVLIFSGVLAVVAGLAWLGHRQPPGKHQHAPRKHLPRRQRHAIEEALHAAWQARVENHPAPPLLATQLQVAALTAAIPCWKPCPAAGGPVPTALADVTGDPEHPYLDRPDWEYATGQWPAFVDSIKGE